MPPTRGGDALRENLAATTQLIREVRALRQIVSALRRETRAGFTALGARMDGLESDGGEGDGGESGGGTAAAGSTGPHLLIDPRATTPAAPVVAPTPAPVAATPSETSSVAVRVDAHGVHASATASPSWLRQYWKILAVLFLLIWGGINAVEKGVAFYRRLMATPPTAPPTAPPTR